MIASSDQSSINAPALEDGSPDVLVLARYGKVPQVAQFSGSGLSPDRETKIVVTTDRGEEMATVLQLQVMPRDRDQPTARNVTGQMLRIASAQDLADACQLEETAEALFPGWLARTVEWKLQLELIDLEYTLDKQLILYVLNDRGPETTRFALLAAAAGLGIVHVQPVSANGLVQHSGGGCGSCTNHSH